MHQLNRLDMVRRGAVAGLNPMFGEWKQFPIEPVSYSNPGEARAASTRRFASTLRHTFFTPDMWALTATLYLAEESYWSLRPTGIWTTMPNLLDALRGPGAP
jgi:hypothetical protein